MKGWIKRGVPALLAAALLSGCGAGVGGQSTEESAQPVNITVWTYYNGAQLDSFNALVKEFNETVGAEEGIQVESFSLGTVNDLETNVLAAAQGKVGAGEIPNIFAAYADTAYALDKMGVVEDLSGYFTEKELEAYVDAYIEEGRFSGDGSIKIFPVAKSTEVFLLNKTDWEPFSAATGATYEDFSTMEGLAATAQAYYEWTDSQTPEPNDGRAFFGRDAMANYFLVGAMQLGTELFQVKNGKMELHFDKDVVRKLWDNYYVPFVKGYFAATGRFRSDDIKTGNVISYVGSSSSATFFPDRVSISDTESYPIEMESLTVPGFAEGAAYAVQQGAGMAVTKGEKREVEASVRFLKWITQDDKNIEFSVGSGYLPVTRAANDMELIQTNQSDLTDVMDRILKAAVDMVNNNTLYTPKAFENGTSARSILEYSMSDRASEDRAVVVERLAEGQTLAQATEDFVSDAYFTAWYESTLASLQELAD